MSQYEYALQFSGSTVGSEAHIDRGVHSLNPDLNACVPIAISEAPFKKDFKISAKNSVHGINLMTLQDNF